MKNKLSIQGLLIWGLATLFYLFEFSLQVFQGTVATDIMQDLHINAEQFAFIGSSFYIAYGIMQPNVGILSDRFGVRNLLLIAIVICCLGVLLLCQAVGFYTALFARLLIGLGSSCSFVAILVLSLNWFPKEFFGFFSGCAQLLGAIGPLLAGAPLAVLMSYLDGNWRLILLWMSAFGGVIFLLMLGFLRDKPKGQSKKLIFLQPSVSFRQKTKYLLGNSQVWWVFLFAACIYTALPLLGAYWGVTYLQTKSLSATQAAFIVSISWLGMAFSCPCVGVLSDRIERRKIFLLLTSVLGIVVSLLILYLPTENTAVFIILFFLLGVASSSQSLTFAVAAENVPRKLQGLALGMNNFFIIMFVAFVPTFVTWLMKNLADTTVQEFTQKDFNRGLVAIPVLYGCAFIIALIGVRETFCRQQCEIHKLERLPHKSSDVL